MKQLNFKPKLKHAGHLVQQNSPTLLSAIAVVGVAATGYLTFRAAYKTGHYQQAHDTLADNLEQPRMTPQEIALKQWKLYIPAVGVAAATVGCIVTSNRIQVRRLAAMAAAYGVLSGDFDEYRNKAVEMLGKTKGKKLDDAVAEQKMTNGPTPPNVPLAENEAWFCDLSTMRYFKSSREKVEKGRNDLNYKLMHGGEHYVDLNEAYSCVGLEATGVGGQLGWSNEQQVDITFTPIFMTDGQTATGFKFSPEPKPDFDER